MNFTNLTEPPVGWVSVSGFKVLSLYVKFYLCVLIFVTVWPQFTAKPEWQQIVYHPNTLRSSFADMNRVTVYSTNQSINHIKKMIVLVIHLQSVLHERLIFVKI